MSFVSSVLLLLNKNDAKPKPQIINLYWVAVMPIVTVSHSHAIIQPQDTYIVLIFYSSLVQYMQTLE